MEANTWLGVAALAVTTLGTAATTIAGFRFNARLTASETERKATSAELAECRTDRTELKARVASLESRLGND